MDQENFLHSVPSQPNRFVIFLGFRVDAAFDDIRRLCRCGASDGSWLIHCYIRIVDEHWIVVCSDRFFCELTHRSKIVVSFEKAHRKTNKHWSLYYCFIQMQINRITKCPRCLIGISSRDRLSLSKIVLKKHAKQFALVSFPLLSYLHNCTK